MPQGICLSAMRLTSLPLAASSTITSLERPQASRMCLSSGVKLKCQQRSPIGYSAMLTRLAASNTCSALPLASAT